MTVDLGELEEWPSNRIPGFNQALLEVLPTLGFAFVFARTAGRPRHAACAMGRGSATLRSTWRSKLQSLAGTEVHLGKTRGAGATGRYNVVYEFREEQVGLEAGRIAVGLVNHLASPEEAPFDFAEALEDLIRLAERQAFGPSTQALVDEAVSRDIPFMRLDRHSLVQLGQGVHQQRIRATMTSRTGAIGVDIASDKSLTNALLSSAGLPVPKADTVRARRGGGAAATRSATP